MEHLIEKDDYYKDLFHIDFRVSSYSDEIIKNLKEKNYIHKNKFSFNYMGKHDYFYLNCGVVLSISYASDTLNALKVQNLEKFKFVFDLNPYND